jgi:hypothetical protein
MAKTQKQFNEDSVRELELYILNTRKIYNMLTPYYNTLLKKSAKGIYNSDRATKGFYSIVHESSKLYSKEFSSGKDYLYLFSPEDKKEVCQRLELTFRNEYITEIITESQEYALELAAR